MKTGLGCENQHGVFFMCNDCMNAKDPLSCAIYRNELNAKIGFEIKG